jgi:hypothetical protein
MLVQQVLVVVLLALQEWRTLLLIADGARFLRAFFTDRLAHVVDKTMLLDWYHLHQKCAELCSRNCHGRQARAKLLLRLYRRLWRGDVAGAIAVLHAYRGQARNTEVLETLIAYLETRQAWIANYRGRLLDQHSIGSGQVEKANDLIVAGWQRRPGMQWSQETSDALAALRTLMLNGGWERYWQQREVMPLAAT